MKKFITLFLGLSIGLYLHGITVYAQGKGHGPASVDNHIPKVKADDHVDHAKDIKPDKDKEADKQAKEIQKEEKADEKIVAHIDRNPQLEARVAGLLPAGMSLKTAAMGFHNQGEFIAALHVSRNLNIPFNQLKTKLTGEHPLPLGKAIEELRPDLSKKQTEEAAELAEKQTKETEKPKAKATT